MGVLDDKIKAFLGIGDGYGDGNGDGIGNGYGDGIGDGDGYGDGNGDGIGNGYGDGYGNGYDDGDGIGNGDGNGYGNGIMELDGMKVYCVDNVPTIIKSIKGNIARGYTIKNNCQLVPCYIAKVGNYFAHGEDAHAAMRDAQAKYDENRPLEERIADMKAKWPTLDTLVPHEELYTLHHVLTGSCRFGRDEFCKTHGLDPTTGNMSIRDFLELTKNSYGSDAIRQAADAYGLKN